MWPKMPYSVTIEGYNSNPLVIFQFVSGVWQESVEVTTEVSKTFNEKIRKYYDITLLSDNLCCNRECS